MRFAPAPITRTGDRAAAYLHLRSWIGGRVAPRLFSNTGGHSHKSGPHRPAVVDDDTPPLPHTRFSLRRLLIVAAAGLLLWCAPMGFLFAVFETPERAVRCAESITTAAVVTRNIAVILLNFSDNTSKPYTTSAVQTAFFTGTAAEVTPMRELDDRRIGTGGPGPVTKKLQAAYFKVIRGERPEYARWLSWL